MSSSPDLGGRSSCPDLRDAIHDQGSNLAWKMRVQPRKSNFCLRKQSGKWYMEKNGDSYHIMCSLQAEFNIWELVISFLILQEEAPYNKGAFKIEINFPAEYPFKPPKITFVTSIYHPNIDEKGQVRWCFRRLYLAVHLKRKNCSKTYVDIQLPVHVLGKKYYAIYPQTLISRRSGHLSNSRV